jgi:hypothetical protein
MNSDTNILPAIDQTKEPIIPPLTNTITPSASTPKSSKLKYLITALLIIIFIGIAFWVFFLFIYHRSITDKEHGFKFTIISGWEVTPSQEGIDLSLATFHTSEGKKFIFSLATLVISPDKTPDEFITRMLNEDNTETIREICKNGAVEKKMTFTNIERLNIPNTNSYKCTSEYNGGPNNNYNTFVFESYFIQKPKYNLLLSTTYQKNLPQEARAVKRLVKGFKVITQ